MKKSDDENTTAKPEEITKAMAKAAQKKQNKNVIPQPFNPDSTTFTIPALPKTDSFNARRQSVVTLTDTSCKTKKLIFGLFNRVHYELFVLNKQKVKSHQYQFLTTIPLFMDWLNSTSLDGVEFEVLKRYQVDLINSGVQGVAHIKTLQAIFSTMQPNEAIKELNRWEKTVVLKWLEYTPLEDEEREQRTITTHFQQYKWLEREDIGIGVKMFAQLVSPEHITRSLHITVGMLGNAIELAQEHGITLVQRAEIEVSDLPLEGKNKKNIRPENCFDISTIIRRLIEVYSSFGDEERAKHHQSLLIITSAFTTDETFLKLREYIENDIDKIAIGDFYKNNMWINPNKVDGLFVIKSRSGLFDIESLKLWVAGKTQHVPLQDLLFHWLMASMTVQPSDIPKLKKEDFKLLRPNNNSRVKAIECDYFKGRAGIVHPIDSIKTKTPHGKFLLSCINRVTEVKDKVCKINMNKAISFPVVNGRNYSELKTLGNIINHIPIIKSKIISEHIKNSTSSAFFNALSVILSVGETKFNYRNEATITLGLKKPFSSKDRQEIYKLSCELLDKKSETKVAVNLLPLSMIKNTAVHSGSDPIDINKLFVRRSHSPSTEESCYLNESNEKWLNSTGRITRNIINDLIHNVFKPSSSIKVYSNISNQKPLESTKDDEDNKECKDNVNQLLEKTRADFLLMRSRLELVTDQKGRVNDIGIMKGESENTTGLPPMLFCDNAETAFKVMAYQSEVEQSYKTMFDNNPDHFLMSVLPNLELCKYIQSKLSTESKKAGMVFLERYKPHLLNPSQGGGA
ncbi:hypothetical protein BIZ37_04365 [Photobacterium sp. BZF1]|uniref:hypothetical protein n=1 Tax=Photobacterium sp. BZF1 TaxID=1904457 RepID=UPI0016539D80|nr:hypothetical protein [Photobacterium sp. BZF1]MBC7001778.1 hypothetical protein [Photobacterium sp. BZF1]